MPTGTAHEKQQVHELVDRLAPSQVTAVRGLLEAMLDSVDAEPATEEDRRRFREGQAWLAQCGGIPMEDVLAEFGLRLEDFHAASENPKIDAALSD